MRFGVLGSLEVTDAGRPLDLGRPKQRAVLALLLLDLNRVVSLDRLIDRLWGDEPPARSTASLQAYVSNLRRVLEPERARGAPSTVLVTAPPGYSLRVDPAALDANRFEALASDGALLLAAGRPEPAVDALDAALALWRGPALAEFLYESFASTAAARWEELRRTAAEDRMEAILALGGHIRAVAELEAMVEEFPLRERCWALLMVALYRCGRQADALRAFARARSILAGELGVDPGPELARLEADILNHAPSLGGRPAQPTAVGGAARPVGEVSPAPARRSPDAERAPFVGRRKQVGALARAFDAVMRGRRRTVLVTGEAGIGKTRLLEELAASASASDALVAWGRAFEGGAAPGFWPWVQVLRTVSLGTDASVLRDAAGTGAGAVAQLVPELGERWGGTFPAAAPVDAASARFRLYEAVHAMLHAAAVSRPLVVLLDDLHWADAASLGLAEFVASQAGEGRLLLVAAYRPEDVSSNQALVATLATLARAPAIERVELGGLTPADVAQLVTETGDAEPTDELVGALHARTEGNPFYLGELLRLLVAERLIATPGAATAARVPAGVRDVLRRRLARLPEPTVAVLRIAAVIGREFDLAILSAAAGLDEDAVLESVETALMIGVVGEVPGTVGRCRFAHSLLRDTLYDQLSGLRRVRIHGAVGHALESKIADALLLDQLAHHFFEAAPVVGADLGYLYAVRAADAAQEQLAYEEAQNHLGRALELVERMPPGPDRARKEIDVQLRRVGWSAQVGSFATPDARRAWDRVAELCEEAGHTSQLLAALSGQWVSAIMRGDYGAACVARDRIVDVARATGDTAAVALGQFHSGYLALHCGQPAVARDFMDLAIAGMRSLDRDQLLEMFQIHPEALFLGISAMALWLLGDVEEARSRVQQARAAADATGHASTRALVFVNSCVIDAWSLDPASLRARADDDIATMAGWGLPVDEAHVRAMRGWAVAREGDPAGTAETAAALEEIEASGRVMSRSWLLGLLADAHRCTGRLDDAMAAVDEAVAVMERTKEAMWAAELYRIKGELLSAAAPERHDEAAVWLDRAVEIAERQGAVPLRDRAERSLASLHDRLAQS